MEQIVVLVGVVNRVTNQFKTGLLSGSVTTHKSYVMTDVSVRTMIFNLQESGRILWPLRPVEFCFYRQFHSRNFNEQSLFEISWSSKYIDRTVYKLCGLVGCDHVQILQTLTHDVYFHIPFLAGKVKLRSSQQNEQIQTEPKQYSNEYS